MNVSYKVVNMKEGQLQLWVTNFEKEVQAIQIEFDAFFRNRKIQDYYRLRVNMESSSISIDIERRDELPSEIIDRLTVAYLKAKPK